jgi:hypothetical protein
MGHESCGIVEDTMEIGGLDGVRSCILAFFRGGRFRGVRVRSLYDAARKAYRF